MVSKKDESKYISFRTRDDDIKAWAKGQTNLSQSLVYMVKRTIQEHGLSDYIQTVLDQSLAQANGAKPVTLADTSIDYNRIIDGVASQLQSQMFEVKGTTEDDVALMMDEGDGPALTTVHANPERFNKVVERFSSDEVSELKPEVVIPKQTIESVPVVESTPVVRTPQPVVSTDPREYDALEAMLQGNQPVAQTPPIMTQPSQNEPIQEPDSGGNDDLVSRLLRDAGRE